MLLAKTLSLSALLVNTVAATTNISQIFYCPYNVKLASPDDPKSLDFEYTPTNAPVNAFMFDGKACLLEVHFFTPDARGDVYLETIEYKSNKAMSIETKLALNAAYAPQIYDTVYVTTSDVAIAQNTTFDSFQLHSAPVSKMEWLFYLQTKFSDAAMGSDFQLTQKISLRFAEGNMTSVVSEWDTPDIDRKFPSCRGVTGKEWFDNCNA